MQQPKDSEKQARKKAKSGARYKPQSWFRHDLDSSTGRKFSKLRLKGGYEAIGLYWAIVELIYRSSNCYSFATADDEQVLADCLRIDRDKLIWFLSLCAECENLLEVREGFLTSKRIEEEQSFSSDLTKKRINAGRKGGLVAASKRVANATAKLQRRSSKKVAEQNRTEQNRTEQNRTEKNNIGASPPLTPPTGKERIGDPPKTPDDPLPTKLIAYFKATGLEEAYPNVWIKESEWEKLCREYGEDLVNRAGHALSAWSNSHDISPKTKQPGWMSYRMKADHLATLKNQIKRMQTYTGVAA